MSIVGMYDNCFDLSNEDFSSSNALLYPPGDIQQNNNPKDNIPSNPESDATDKKKGKWTKEEDDILCLIVRKYGGKNWRRVSEHIQGRTPIQCLHRWTKILMPGLVKGPWTIEEDRKLKEWVMKQGAERWSQCAETIPGRSGKQCRERWCNSLNPQIKKGNWGSEEDYRIFLLYRKCGGKWSKIAGYFEGRTENSIKNRFYSSLRRVASGNKRWETTSMGQATSIGLDELIKLFPRAMKEAADKFKKSEGLSSEDLNKYEAQVTESLNKSSYKKPDFKFAVTNNHTSHDTETSENTHQKVISNSSSTTNINMNINFNSSSSSNYILCTGKQNANDIATPSLQENNYNYRNMDLMTLEKEIYDMCDNSSSMFFQDAQALNIDNQLDSILDDIFDKNHITVTCDREKECKICHEIPSQRKDTGMDMWKNNFDDGKSKGDMLHSLLTQLNDLEKLVKSTKKELMKYEMPGNDEYMDMGCCIMNNSTLGNNIDSIFKI